MHLPFYSVFFHFYESFYLFVFLYFEQHTVKQCIYYLSCIKCSIMLILLLFIIIIIVMLCPIQEVLDSLRLQLEEKHTVELANLRTSMVLSFKEELQEVRHKLSPSIYNASTFTKTE